MLVLVVQTLISSEAKHVQSLIFIQYIKPLCSLEMTIGKMEDSLCVGILDIILYLKLGRVISLNIFIVCALFGLRDQDYCTSIIVGEHPSYLEKLCDCFTDILLNNLLVCMIKKHHQNYLGLEY